MKKAQGISMNVIIIAALALLVLVVLAIVFMNRMHIFTTEYDRCENKGGVCQNQCTSTQHRMMDAVCYTGGQPDSRHCCQEVS